MKIKQHHITVQKTARIFSLGALNEDTKQIWFVFHGYAQTADEFLDSLRPLLTKDSFLIAPEGLSRFYWKDFTNHPVASWMTKLDRALDLKDNESYLNQLYQSFPFDETKIQINYLGFSQGTATMSRWIAKDQIKVNKIIFYAGKPAHDIDFSQSTNFKTSKIQFIYGSNDPFIKSKDVNQMEALFDRHRLNIQIKSFNGKHKICQEGLQLIE